MESPVNRVFGLDFSNMQFVGAYTATKGVDSAFQQLSNFNSGKSIEESPDESPEESPSTIPFDRVRKGPIASSKFVESDTLRRVEIRLSDFAPMMIDAAESNRSWVQDFEDDLISIPKDLYEVMLAYQRMRRAS